MPPPQTSSVAASGGHGDWARRHCAPRRTDSEYVSVMKLVVWAVDLQGQLTQAEQHATQYKSIADSVESSLREQTAASEQFRQTLEARITETQQGTPVTV